MTIIEGGASGFVFANLTVLMSELIELSTRGTAVGVYRTFMDIGGILGPIIITLLYTYFSAAAAFLSAAFIFLLSIGALFFAKYNVRTVERHSHSHSRLLPIRCEQESYRSIRSL